LNRYNLPFREDSSNVKTEYRRNFLRHKVVPLLKELNPNLPSTLAGSSRYRRELTSYLDRQAEALRKATTQGKDHILPLSIIKDEGWNPALLHFAFESCGFTYLQWQRALAEPWPRASKRFRGIGFTLYREVHPVPALVVAPAADREFSITFAGPGSYTTPFGEFVFEEISSINLSELRNPTLAHLNTENLKFPLTLRLRQTGDRFQPFGMKDRKKLSDFLQDEKVPRYQRDRQLVLLSGEEIAWVVGRRVAEPYRVSLGGGRILQIRIV
jgi:tRNA(Ile)-lysidine synthase